jgi:hypothetical protein
MKALKESEERAIELLKLKLRPIRAAPNWKPIRWCSTC